MSVYDVAYENLCHTHSGIYTAAEISEYIQYKKGMELERNFSLIFQGEIFYEFPMIFPD